MLLAGPDTGRAIALAIGRCTIGRTRATTIALAHGSVSREHCVLDLAADGSATIVDQGSENGTFVESRPIAPGVVVAIEPGSVIEVGAFALTVRPVTEDDGRGASTSGARSGRVARCPTTARRTSKGGATSRKAYESELHELERRHGRRLGSLGSRGLGRAPGHAIRDSTWPETKAALDKAKIELDELRGQLATISQNIMTAGGGGG